MSPKGEAGELKQTSTAGVAVPASGAQGLLFTEDLPVLDEDAGYRGPTACKAAGITYRQLDYWARTGLVEPAVRGAAGSGSQRLYGFRDILVLKVVKRLLDTGVSLQQIRTAVEHLRERGVEDLAQITLMSDGASVYECTSADEVIDLVQGGQGVFGRGHIVAPRFLLSSIREAGLRAGTIQLTLAAVADHARSRQLPGTAGPHQVA
ncbi:MerR family transcriptional regulator [Arthrobacter sp. YAF16]|uniref:MerR family transcriptional regulator n=1 Tax=Arthrobacter sp. YAF16 TaxID=3233076 RepID=UPI003F8F5D83